MIRQTLGADKSVPIVLFSSETGLGRDQLWETILEAIDDAGMSAAQRNAEAEEAAETDIEASQQTNNATEQANDAVQEDTAK